MPLEALDDAVVPITEVQQEVVVVEQVACHCLLVNLHLQIVYSCWDRFLVVHALWCRRR